MKYTGEWSNLEASHFSQTSIWAHICVHVTHSFSYPKACKCRVFRIAIKPCQTILVTLDCSQCRGSRLKKYNRCHNMGGWAVNSQSLKCYLLAFAYYRALPPLSRDLLHERNIGDFMFTNTWRHFHTCAVHWLAEEPQPPAFTCKTCAMSEPKRWSTGLNTHIF